MSFKHIMTQPFRNHQLEKFNYNILCKDWLLSQIFRFVNSDIEILFRHQLYRINKIRTFKAPSIDNFIHGLINSNGYYINQDNYYINQDSYYINEDGIVFNCYYFSKFHTIITSAFKATQITTNIFGNISSIMYRYEQFHIYVNLEKSMINNINISHYIEFDIRNMQIMDCPSNVEFTVS